MGMMKAAKLCSAINDLNCPSFSVVFTDLASKFRLYLRCNMSLTLGVKFGP
jgi:hypothetical protein